MDDKELRDKQDRDLTPGLEKAIRESPGVEKSPDLDCKSNGCPTCGNEDIQSAELLEAWKKIEELEKRLVFDPSSVVCREDGTPIRLEGGLLPVAIDWEQQYEKVKEAYVKTRLEVSGSFGNWDYATRKRVLENEISVELGFKV